MLLTAAVNVLSRALPFTAFSVLQAAHQGPAVLGLAMISMGEELGATMSLRMLEHLLRYGEPAVRCCPGCLMPGM